MAPWIACPSCSCHVRAGELVCPHCGAALAVGSSSGIGRTAGSVLLGLAVVAGASACRDETSGAGGMGSGSGSSSSSASSATQAVATTGWFNSASTYGGAPTCYFLPCSDEDSDDTNDCLSCSQTRGECVGESLDCADNLECAALRDCIAACPSDDPATMGNEYADCVCTNDAVNCAASSDAGTCLGDYPNGESDYRSLYDCLVGDGVGADRECTVACSSRELWP